MTRVRPGVFPLVTNGTWSSEDLGMKVGKDLHDCSTMQVYNEKALPKREGCQQVAKREEMGVQESVGQ